MTIHKLFSSRSRVSTGNTYVGEAGRLFYDEADGEIRLSNGVTPGGVAISVRADLITAQRLLPGEDNNNAYGLGDETHRWWDAHIGDGGIHYNGFSNPQTAPYLPGAIITDLVPAYTNGNLDLGSNTNRWGNVFIGPNSLRLQDQITLNDVEIIVRSGTLYLNGAQNLAVGNLTIVDTTLTSATNNLDISIGATDDTGFFYVKRKAQFDNTTFTSTQAMVSMNASGAAEPTTIFPDTVLQTVGRPNRNSRIIQRSYGSTGELGGDNSYSVWGSYVARGNIASPAAVKANDILSRLSSNGYGTTTWGSGGTRIESVALENFTDSAKGSKINFWTTPIGSIVSQQVASITATGISANSVTFTTDGSIQTSNAIPFSQKAIPGAAYVATLGIDGRLDSSQIPTSLSGATIFKGAWNANTNTPSLSDSTPAGLQAGWQYIVSIGGTRDIGDGSETFAAGDTVIYDGTHWKRIAAANNLTYATATSGTHVLVNGNQGTQETGVLTFTTDATPNTGSGTIVSRDANGNFQANIITAALSGQATSALTAATVTTGVQSAITAVGTLTSLAVTGNATAGNVTSTTGTITAATGQFTNINNSLQTVSANIGAFHTYANTSLNSLATGANANTAAYLTTATGNISAGNVIATTNFRGNVIGTATQLATAGTTAAGTFLAGTISAAFTVPKNTPISTQTFTVSGLTTSHKIIITSNTAMPDETYFIAAAWASATNTVSIQIAHTGGGAFTATFNISYFAWV